MTTRVLVTSASRHGATIEIGDVIAGVLSRRGLEVIQLPVDEISDVVGFDAAVIGSGVYVGRWMNDAIELVERHATQLSAMPVWLFSSGPLGDPPRPGVDPVDIAKLAPSVGARGHRLFSGKLDPARLGKSEKLIVGIVRAPSGDYRDFAAVEAWAHEIADEILGGARNRPLQPAAATG